MCERKAYASAVKQYRNAVRLSPGNLAAKLGLANALFFVQQYEEADGLVAVVLRKEPKSGRCLLLRADLLRARAKSSEAKMAYERVIELAPKSHQAQMAQKILTEW